MRFRRDTNETSCGASIPDDRYEALACMRTAGHDGEHIARMDLAAKADGVCHGCRVKLGAPHRDDCFARRTSEAL